MRTEDYSTALLEAESNRCICCQSVISEHNDFCDHCHTPTEITRSVGRRQKDPHFISIVGPSNAGKTVYLGVLLDMLCGGSQNLKGIPNGAFSIGLQEIVVRDLEERRFPGKTPNESDLWNWLHCVVSDNTPNEERTVDFVAPDFAGEAIAMELEQPGTYPAVENIIKRTSAFLLLCDSMEVRDNGSSADLFAMKLGSYIVQKQSLAAQEGHDAVTPAVGVIFTKSDTCLDAEQDPARFLANNMPRFRDFCFHHFPKHEAFSASIVGSSVLLADSYGGNARVPLHIQPKGVIEPLKWAIQNS